MPRPTITTRRVETADTGRLTEFLYDDGENDETLVCAAHGGEVEPGTAEAAIELATRLPDASCWACLGYDEEDAFDRWHPPSSAIAPADYPLLAEVADRGFATVVSLHGLADDEVLVGGGVDEDTKRRVRDRLRGATTLPVRTVADGPYAGSSPDNFVNWLAADGTGGLQLEQGPTARSRDASAIVDALAELVAADAL